MPDSKLAEKLGFRVAVPPGAHPEAFDVIYNNGRESDWATPAEIALWNLCLELSAENENFHKQLGVDGFIPQRPVAEKEKKA